MYNLYKNLPLENRDTKKFLKHFTQNEKPGRRLLRKKIIKELVNFFSTQKQEQFEWFTVSLTRIPCDYQIQSYVEGLQKNIVDVLNAGAGKILTASMIVAKIHQLYQSRMGLMLVDRILFCVSTRRCYYR